MRLSFIVCSLLTLWLGTACADETATVQETAWQKNVALMFHRDEPRPFARYPEEVWEYLIESDGFYTQLSATTVYQRADSSRTDRQDLLNMTYEFAGAWQLLPGLRDRGGALSWWVRGGRPIGDGRTSSLSTDIGSRLNVNATLEDTELFLPELFWGHGISDSIRYSVGYIDPSFRYDFNAVANDDRSSFLALPLVNSATIPFPNAGLGADLLWVPRSNFNAHIGLYQSSCEKTETCFDKLSGDDWFLPAEVTYSPTIEGWGEGNYRVLVFSSRNGRERGSGLSISLDQQIGRFTPFLRWSSADAEVTEFKRFFSIGVGFSGPLNRQYDQLGIGLASGEPSNASVRRETIVEAYWRFRLNSYVTLTPDIQLVIDPADNPVKDRIVVAGLRMQLDF